MGSSFGKEKKMFFSIIFKDILVNISHEHLKCCMLVENSHMEGTVSQILYLGISFHFMKSRKIICNNSQKVSCFLT